MSTLSTKRKTKKRKAKTPHERGVCDPWKCEHPSHDAPLVWTGPAKGDVLTRKGVYDKNGRKYED